MGRFSTAFRAFFAALGSPDTAQRLAVTLDTPPGAPRLPAPAAPAAPSPRPQAPSAAVPPVRSDALTLLAILQREGRLIDFLKEDLSAYTDAQIGAAVRDVHRDSAAALERLFALRPLRTEPEGSPLTVPAGFDASQFRLTGNVAGQPPHLGHLRHPGWQATHTHLPTWTGSPASANVVAPAEVEIA